MKHVAKVIIHKDKAVLLQHRDNISEIPYPGYWSLFGGKIEENETPEQALRRELDEEIGIALDNPVKLEIISRDTTIHHVFIVEQEVNVEKTNLTEGQDLKYIKVSNLDRYKITPFYKEKILEYLS